MPTTTTKTVPDKLYEISQELSRVISSLPIECQGIARRLTMMNADILEMQSHKEVKLVPYKE